MKTSNYAIVLACALLASPAAAKVLDFDVTLTSEVDSKTAKVGQKVYGKLVSDLKDGGKVLAPAGSQVVGHVTEVFASRRLIHSEVSTKRWLKAGGGVGMQFDKIGSLLKVKAEPVSVVSVPGEHGKDKPVTVGKDGAVEAARKRDLKPKVGRSVLGVAAFVAGPITAVAGGVVGAAKPSAVLPDAQDAGAAKHRRLKGLATGFVAGLPGGFLVNDSVLKGQQAILKPGTRLKLEWQR